MVGPTWPNRYEGAVAAPLPRRGIRLIQEDDQLMDLRAAGIGVFQHCLGPAVFAWIVDQSAAGFCDGLV
jgi:hypothetical protein